MAIQLTKKQSDLEKRLQLIRRQVYGKNQTSDKSDDRGPLKGKTTESSSDISYLSEDLLKIGVLASTAIGAQIVLYYLKFF